MQTAVKRQPSEAELRRAEFKVYEGRDGVKAKKQQDARREQRRLRFQQRAKVLFAVFGLFLMSMSYVFLTTQTTMLGYEINKQIALNDELNNDNARLMLEIEMATSPEKVNEYAEQHLNMVAATEDSVVYYDTNAKPVVRTANSGMAVETAAIGYGSVEVVEPGKKNSLVEAIGSFFGSLVSRDGAGDNTDNTGDTGDTENPENTDNIQDNIQGEVQVGMQN